MVSALTFFIIFYIIIYYIFKKAASFNNVNKEEILMKSGFSNIQRLYESVTAIYYSAIKRGDNYLISYMKEYLPSMNSINLLAKEMKDRHYHKGVLVCISVPQQSLIEYGKKNSIEVTTIFDLRNSINTNIGAVSNNTKTYEVYQEIKNDSPIQEPSKSYWKDFFKKPDRL